MTKKEFKQLTDQKILILDGATGSNLQKRGMPAGICPELWITEHPETLQQLQSEYIKAGSDILYAPTFSGNRIKMEEYGLGDQLEEINTKLVQICKENAAGHVLTAADITMTGAQLEPLGDLKFEELIQVYKEQLSILAAAGVDLIAIETMMSLQETRAAVIAAREVCPELPVMAALSFTEAGKTLYGASAESAVAVLQELGVDAVGLNCSAGPDKMKAVLKKMAEVSKIPLIAKPNAGLPSLDENGNTVYDMNKEDFCTYMKELIGEGAQLIGGCCGTNPEYIAELKALTKSFERPVKTGKSKLYLASEREVFAFTEGQQLKLGEGIDVTKDEELMEELRRDEYETATDLAFDLLDDEADALRFFADADGIDEAEALLSLIQEVTSVVSLPVVIASRHAETVETVLRNYSGIAAVECLAESEDEKTQIFSAVKRYGAKLVTIDKKIIYC
ncbi:Methionine synthase [uncultured Roseburia sp.]|uniref:Methionine synthase n=1 Tax=Brotonthovivens ammoniilytica TaxID=2981725 RepID=A0ABT2TG15_9FIRM|nr:homocysteine S-methyltransferase family protein [Brotonthovivens ammoniilytica]MCU6761128.1 homocysteine S-methyltransferase family protein [Brotonthovivens ammoniilytica]SCI19708.1 Methionine synthase [uncultured Roseburia sp.]